MRRVFWGCVGVLAGTIALGAAGYLRPASHDTGPFRAEAFRPMTSRAASVPSLQAGRVSFPPPPATNPPGAASDYGTLVKDYCVTCHNARLATGGLVLDQLSIEQVGEHPETWEKVVAKLRAGQMPPVGMRRPDKPALDALVAYLETELDRAALADPRPGKVVLRRLNRY